MSKTYGSNYNGTQLWARVYLPHGAMNATAETVTGCAQIVLAPASNALGVPLSQWRMDYNQNGIYFECRVTPEREAELIALGFKRSKLAALCY
jgi:hypothetical protein